jgi:hypothetical protein
MKPDLTAAVILYSTSNGGRIETMQPGYGCVCTGSKSLPIQGGFDARLLLGEQPLHPGEQREVGFVFLTAEGTETARKAGKFYLWDGRFVGEATIAGN